jgi:hypothetical protein
MGSNLCQAQKKKIVLLTASPIEAYGKYEKSQKSGA